MLDRLNAIASDHFFGTYCSQVNKSNKQQQQNSSSHENRLILRHRPVTLTDSIPKSPFRPTRTQSTSNLASTMGSQSSRLLLDSQQFHARGRHLGGSQAPYQLIDKNEKHKRVNFRREKVRKSMYTQTLRTKVGSDGNMWFY